MKRLIVALLILSIPCFAALPATAVWEIRSSATAGNVNGGGFNSARGGTDYTLQDAAQEAQTDGAALDTSTTFTSTAATFADAMKGNYIHIASGTQCTVGWYEVVSVTDADNVVLDRTPAVPGQNCTAATYKLGGAMSLASSLDDVMFESAVPGNVFWIKAGTYTQTSAITITAAGGAQNPIWLKGYNATRGDNPTDDTRPLIIAGAQGISWGTNWNISYLRFTTSSSTGLTSGASSVLHWVKSTNISTTAGRAAISHNTDMALLHCEAVSYRGYGISVAGSGGGIFYSYVHDSDIGIRHNGATGHLTVVGNIVENNVTSAIRLAAAVTAGVQIIGNTLYGSDNKLGVGVDLTTGVTDVRAINNIISGFTTGIAHADVQTVGYDDYNSYYNNTTSSTNWTLGAHSTTGANPTFTNVAQVLITAATTSNTGNTLTKSGATFQAAGVTAGRDFVYISNGGAGATVGIYGIVSVDSETQLTLDLAPGSSTDDVNAQITTGHNFAIGTPLKALGYPGAFPAGLTTGYTDIGAVPRQEPTAGASGASYMAIK